MYNEFKKVKDQVKTVLTKSRSKIHISFDIWTSPNRTPVLGVCAHFLSPSLELKHPLLTLRFIGGRHIGLGIADVITEVIDKYKILPYSLRVYVSDNIGNYTVVIRSLIEYY